MAAGNTHKNLAKIGRVVRRYARGQTDTDGQTDVLIAQYSVPLLAAE